MFDRWTFFMGSNFGQDLREAASSRKSANVVCIDKSIASQSVILSVCHVLAMVDLTGAS